MVTTAEAGCTVILTEGLADGATLAGVRIVNPFAGAFLSPAAEGVADRGLTPIYSLAALTIEWLTWDARGLRSLPPMASRRGRGVQVASDRHR